MELKDDAFLRQKIDEIAKNFNQGGRENNTRFLADQRTGESGNDRSGSGSKATVNRYSGSVSFSYPGDWIRVNQPNPQFQFLVSQIHPSDNSAFIEIYELNGMNDAQTALHFISKAYFNVGVQVQYQYVGQKGVFQQFSGVSGSMAGSVQWNAYFKTQSGKVTGIVFSSTPQLFQQYQGVFSNILSTVN